MHIRHDRDGRAFADCAQRVRGLHVWRRAAHDVAARVRQRANLRERGFRVPGIGVCHRLHRDRRAAADRHRTDVNLSCFHEYTAL